jgi:SAM-dependent MidA family methyltransferase
VWQQLGKPTALRLAELGPGRGTLMRDLLAVAHTDPEFAAAVRVHFVESSVSLRKTQRNLLGRFSLAFASVFNNLPLFTLLSQDSTHFARQVQSRSLLLLFLQ